MKKNFTKLFRNLLLFVCMITSLTATANEHYWVGDSDNTPATALNFDGVNDYVSINNTLGNFSGDFSIEMNVRTLSPFVYLISKRGACDGNNILNMQIANSRLQFEISGAGASGYAAAVSSGPVVNDGNWHHVAVTRKSGQITLYVDAITVATAFSNAVVSNTQNLTLGSNICNGQNGSSLFKGDMDEVRIWSRALCLGEMINNLNKELSYNSGNGLLAYYKLNKGNINTDNNPLGLSVPDATGSNNGTLINFGLTGATSNWVAGFASGTASLFAPTASITASGATTFCQGGSVTLMASTGSSYLWSNGATTQSINVTTSGNYTVTVTTNGCSATSAATIITATPQPIWYQDNDNDGLGNPAVSQQSCTQPAGYVSNGDDCNDNLPNITDWTTVGANNIATNIANPSIALDNTGKPYTVFTDNANGYGATVKTLNGTSWTTLGNAGLSGGVARFTSIAIDANNVVYIAYQDGNASDKATVRKFVSGTWQIVGSAGFSIGTSSYLQLKLDNSNVPYVIYGGFNATDKATVMKFDGSNWQVVGNAGFSAGNAYFPNLAFDASNNIYATYVDGTSPQFIFVKKLVGSTWNSVGGSISSGFANNPSLAFDQSATPYIAYSDGSAGQKAQVRKFDGTNWVQVGAVGISNGPAFNTNIAFNQNNIPHISYRESGSGGITANVKKFDGTNWINVGSAFGSDIANPVMQIKSGYPIHVAYQEGRFPNATAQVKKFVTQVNNPSSPTISSSAGITLCAASTSTTLSIASGTLGDAANWYWYTGSCGGTLIGTGNNINVNPSTTTTYYVRGEGSCLETAGSCGSITVTVNSAPAITCPANMVVNNDAGQCGANVTFAAATATGSPTPTITYSLASGSFFPIGITQVICTASNSCGTVSCTFTVTVIDNQPPTISAPTAVNVNADKGSCAATSVSLGTPTTADNCGVVSVTNDAPAYFPAGTTTVTWTVTDIHENTATATQTVTVTDNEKPVITASGNQSVNNNPGKCGATVSMTATANDNCGVGSPVGTRSDGLSLTDLYPVGSTTVTWNVTDIHGNLAIAVSRTVVVTDNEKPVVKTKPVSITLVNGVASISATDVNNGSTDNCGISNISVSPSVFYCANIGSNTVTITVKDIHGNTNTGIAVVTVTGGIPGASIVSVPTNTTYTGGNNNNLYLGYGAQSTTLKVTPSAVSGNGSNFAYSYSWSSTNSAALSMLSSTNAQAPIFTPTVAGFYTFIVTVTNNYGCTTTTSISICVRDIRVAGSNGKVYLCHVPPGNKGNPNTLIISVNAVPAHLGNHPDDRLGSCDMQACGTVVESVATTTTAFVQTEISKESVKELIVLASPNPTSNQFRLDIKSNDITTPVTVKITDAVGRPMDVFNKASAGSSVTFGAKYSSGSYYALVIQGTQYKVVKLIKAL